VLRFRRKNILLIFVSLLVGLMYFFSQPRYNIYIFAFLFYLPAHIFWRTHKSISPFFWGGFFLFYYNSLDNACDNLLWRFPLYFRNITSGFTFFCSCRIFFAFWLYKRKERKIRITFLFF